MQLHRDLAKDGLVMISLDVEQGDWDEKEKVLKFLTDQKAEFPNYVFRDKDEAVEAWMTKFGVEYTPATVAFNRKGERVVMPEVKVEGTAAERQAAQVKAEREFVLKLLGEK